MNHIKVTLLDGRKIKTAEPIKEAKLLDDGFLYLYDDYKNFLGAVNGNNVNSFLYEEDKDHTEEELRARLATLRGQLPPKFGEQCLEALNFIESGSPDKAFKVLIEMLLYGDGDAEDGRKIVPLYDADGNETGSWIYSAE